MAATGRLPVQAGVHRRPRYGASIPGTDRTRRRFIISEYRSVPFRRVGPVRIREHRGALESTMRTQGRAMIRIALLALTGIALTFASAEALDNSASANAAVAFGQFGLSGLALAGRAPYGYPPFGPTEYAPVGQPEYMPVCWTQYVTISNGNTLVNLPHTICR
jgi:hypothetical protein